MPDAKDTPTGRDGENPHLKFNRNVLPELTRRAEPELEAVSRTDKHTREETDSLIKWIGLAIIVIVVAAICGLVLSQRDTKPAEQGGTATATAAAADLVELDRREVKSLVKKYLATTTIPDRLKFVRRAEQVAPLMENYYTGQEMNPLEIWSYEHVEPHPNDEVPFWYVVVHSPGSREILLLEKTGDGFRVDWETHVGHNPVPPDAYVRERPEGKLDFRVYVSPDDYYAGKFSERGKLLAAKLEFLKSDVSLVGYIDRKSPDFSRFLRLVDQRERVPMILTLEWPADDGVGVSIPPQVKICGLVSERWVIVD